MSILSGNRQFVLMNSQEWLITCILDKEMLPDFRLKRMKLPFGSCNPGRYLKKYRCGLGNIPHQSIEKLDRDFQSQS